MKRALILTLALIVICLVALWISPSRHNTAPVDVVIDHMPYCAQRFDTSLGGNRIVLTGVERGVCTTRNVIRN